MPWEIISMFILWLAILAPPFSVKFTPIFGNCTSSWEYREHGTLCIRFTYKLFIFSCFSHWITACTTGSDENFMRIYHVLGWYTAKFTYLLFPSPCASHCLFFHLPLLRFIEPELSKDMFQIYPWWLNWIEKTPGNRRVFDVIACIFS